MSLATRCPHCSTAFKVVQDQLKMSGGWVRCGTCSQPFNAPESLFELPASPTAPPASEEGHVVRGSAAVTHFDLDLPPSQEAVESAMRALLEAEALRPPQRSGPEFADAQFPPDWNDEAIWSPPAPPIAPPETLAADLPTDAGAPPSPPTVWGVGQASPPPLAQEPTATSPSEAPPSLPDDPAASPLPDASDTASQPPAKAHPLRRRIRKPDFVRQAERLAWWRQPAVRGVLTGLALALTLLLVAQGIHQHRDRLASAWPASAPWLQAWCEQAHCTLQPVQDLDDLQVETTSLAHADGDAPGTLQLKVALRNRAAGVRAWPHIDLTLTDANGTVLSRRLIDARTATPVPTAPDQPTQPLPPAMAAHAGTELQWRLSAPDLPLASYTVELFYP